MGIFWEEAEFADYSPTEPGDDIGLQLPDQEGDGDSLSDTRDTTSS